MLAGGKLQRRFSVSIFHQIHCDNGLTGIGAASIIVSSEIAEFEELDGDLVEGIELPMARSVFLPGPARRELMA